jgi:hypothetical protein
MKEFMTMKIFISAATLMVVLTAVIYILSVAGSDAAADNSNQTYVTVQRKDLSQSLIAT